ncbi:zinc-dependent metalloprotease [Larkinella harenae]
MIGVHGQTLNCRTSAPTRAFGQQLLEVEKQYLRQRTSARVAEEVTTVRVKVHVFLMTVRPNDFPQVELDTTLAYLNRAFQPANIRFQWAGATNYVRNDSLARIPQEKLETVFNAYKVDDAVNLFFFPQVHYGGFSYLPDIGSDLPASNVVFISGENLGERLNSYMLPHEFGHYFGLAHTFDQINGQELVARGPEGNCAVAGDLICDTPADPYGTENPSCFSYTINKQCFTVCDARDARNNVYQPDFKNIMSYYNMFSCPGQPSFTPGQYLRMKAGLLMRLHCPLNKKYSISPQKPAPALGSAAEIEIVDGIVSPYSNIQRVARNATVLATYQTRDVTLKEHAFTVTLLPSHLTATYEYSGYLSREVSATVVAGRPNTIAFKIPEEHSSSVYMYNFKVNSNDPNLLSCPNATYLSIVDPPVTKLAFRETESDSIHVRFGDSVSLRIWNPEQVNSFQSVSLLVNEQSVPFLENHPDFPHVLYRDYYRDLGFFKNSTVRLNNVRVVGGQTERVGLLKVSVQPPQLRVQLPAGFSACAGQAFSTPFQTDIQAHVIEEKYQLQLSDEQGRFLDDSTRIIGQNQASAIQAVFPGNLSAGNAYRVRLLVATPQGKIAGETSEPLTIRPRPQAALTAEPASIYAGDSTQLTIALTGEPPWSYTLSNGQSRTASQSPVRVVVKPQETTDYRVTALQNACGMGTVSGSATVTVLKPLGNEPAYSGSLRLRLWPNPVGNRVFVEWQGAPGRVVRLSLMNLNGQVLQNLSLKGSAKSERQEVNVMTLPTGRYYIQASDGAGQQTLPFLKN